MSETDTEEEIELLSPVALEEFVIAGEKTVGVQFDSQIEWVELLEASQPQVLEASQPQVLEASQPQVLEASQPQVEILPEEVIPIEETIEKLLKSERQCWEEARKRVFPASSVTLSSLSVSIREQNALELVVQMRPYVRERHSLEVRLLFPFQLPASPKSPPEAKVLGVNPLLSSDLKKSVPWEVPAARLCHLFATLELEQNEHKRLALFSKQIEDSGFSALEQKLLKQTELTLGDERTHRGQARAAYACFVGDGQSGSAAAGKAPRRQREGGSPALTARREELLKVFLYASNPKNVCAHCYHCGRLHGTPLPRPIPCDASECRRLELDSPLSWDLWSEVRASGHMAEFFLCSLLEALRGPQGKSRRGASVSPAPSLYKKDLEHLKLQQQYGGPEPGNAAAAGVGVPVAAAAAVAEEYEYDILERDLGHLQSHLNVGALMAARSNPELWGYLVGGHLEKYKESGVLKQLSSSSVTNVHLLPRDSHTPILLLWWILRGATLKGTTYTLVGFSELPGAIGGDTTFTSTLSSLLSPASGGSKRPLTLTNALEEGAVQIVAVHGYAPLRYAAKELREEYWRRFKEERRKKGEEEERHDDGLEILENNSQGWNSGIEVEEEEEEEEVVEYEGEALVAPAPLKNAATNRFPLNITAATAGKGRRRKRKRQAVGLYPTTTTHFYHGSSIGNWHSILRGGLVVLSGTQYMSAGAAYGSGIYMASPGFFPTSYIYSAPRMGTQYIGPKPFIEKTTSSSSSSCPASALSSSLVKRDEAKALLLLSAWKATEQASQSFHPAFSYHAPQANPAFPSHCRTNFLCYAILRVEAGTKLVVSGVNGIHVAPRTEDVQITHLVLLGGR